MASRLGSPRLPGGSVQRDTAATVLSRPQQAFIAALALALVAEALAWGWHAALVTVVAACEVFYFAFVGFKVLLAVASYLPVRGAGTATCPRPATLDLPTFTIFLPNVKEKPHVLRALLESMATLDYPADKLQVMLLVEHWDDGDPAAVRGGRRQRASGRRADRRLPRTSSVCVSIPGAPGTKPAPATSACTGRGGTTRSSSTARTAPTRGCC